MFTNLKKIGKISVSYNRPRVRTLRYKMDRAYSTTSWASNATLYFTPVAS